MQGLPKSAVDMFIFLYASLKEGLVVTKYIRQKRAQLERLRRDTLSHD